MAGRLAGQRVVVTDAEEFMGPAVCALFAEEGAEVVAERGDLRQPGACEALIEGAGRVDVLIANLAATYSGSPAHETEDGEFERLLARLVWPLHRLTRAVLPQLIERRRGKIVVVGSAAALKGVPGRAAYAAARGAQHAYVRTVGIEAAPHRVNVNATGQSFVENPTYFPPEYQMTEEFRARMQAVPAARLATGREAAQFILFLAGPESDFFFGQVFPFAGGWVT